MKHILFLFLFVSVTPSAVGGPGHDHGEGAFAGKASPSNHFVLTEQQIKNLGIRSSKPTFLPISRTVNMLAFTELLPERRSSVSLHFEGVVLSLDAKVGEEVKKGQLLAKAKAVNIGAKEVSFYSPIDGYVLELNAELGEILPTGGKIMHIGDPRQMLVHGIAYETPDISFLEIGQAVEVHLDIAPERHIEGKVQRINKVIDPETRTFSVYALINTPEGDIQPGLQASMEIFTGSNTPVLTVPKRAVLGELGSYFVYVINGEHFEKRNVIVGAKTSHHIEIKSGLFPYESVVTNGNYQLQYISIGGVQEHDHDEKEVHSHDDENGHAHSSEPIKESREIHNHDDENHLGHDHHDHSGHNH